MVPDPDRASVDAQPAVDVALALREEAQAVDERRLLVLSGDRERGYDVLGQVLDRIDVPIRETTLVGPEDRLRCEQVPVPNADRLLGTTRELVIVDAHREFRPNALGRVVGAVDGGGLLVVLAPALDAWPDRRDDFDESLAVPPFDVADVTGRFRTRLVETLRAHRGVALVDVDRGRIESDGLTDPAPRIRRADSAAANRRADQNPADRPPGDSRFPAATYDACLTGDQADAVAAFERLIREDVDATGSVARAVVLESDRGRGKSSTAGLAAGALAARGDDVLVTAPSVENATELFERAGEVLATIDELGRDGERGDEGSGVEVDAGDDRTLTASSGGRIRYLPPTDAVEAAAGADVLIVDEAAALPVSVLSGTLAADRVAYATTIHGYEGAGRGFSVRFRDRLEEGRHEVTGTTLAEPIRYAPGDPVEVWAFRALLLDARPPVEPLVRDATPETVAYRRPDADDLLADDLLADDLLADEHRLRETFGLLVLAHYRTDPNDLARLLDAPNLRVRTLEHDGHVVGVALLAREGGLDAETRAGMYEGDRIRGNMLPDVLTSQLRDESAGEPVGYRVVRIATHHAVRSRGLGSHLLARIREEFADDVDWLGTGFGATPGLLRFWRSNGYGTVHCSTTRNDRSGEHSAIMLAPTSEAGRELRDRHARWFARRAPAVFGDSLAELDVDVARALLRSVPADAAPPLELDEHEWRIVAGAAYGPGLLDVDPGPFRRLVARYFVDESSGAAPAGDGSQGESREGLPDREERLLVRRCLQGRVWGAVADELDFHSTGQCMRATGDALTALVDRYGADSAAVRAVRDRFSDSG